MGEVVGVAEMLIRSLDWSGQRQATGAARDVGLALADLLGAETPEAASAAYWRLENHAVVQGEVFQVAEPCVGVLVSAFADPRPRHMRICALDLLFQILGGAAADAPGTPRDIVSRCRSAARQGLWGLVREAIVGERDAAWEILALMDLGDQLEQLRVGVTSQRAVIDGTTP